MMQIARMMCRMNGGDSMDEEYKRGYALGYRDAVEGREYQSDTGRGLFDYGYGCGYEDAVYGEPYSDK